MAKNDIEKIAITNHAYRNMRVFAIIDPNDLTSFLERHKRKIEELKKKYQFESIQITKYSDVLKRGAFKLELIES